MTAEPSSCTFTESSTNKTEIREHFFDYYCIPMTIEANLVEKLTCIRRKKFSVVRNCTVLFKVKERHDTESRTKAHLRVHACSL